MIPEVWWLQQTRSNKKCIVSESKAAQVSSYFLKVLNLDESVFLENQCIHASLIEGSVH